MFPNPTTSVNGPVKVGPMVGRFRKVLLYIIQTINSNNLLTLSAVPGWSDPLDRAGSAGKSSAVQQVVGSIPGRVKPDTFKIVTALSGAKALLG